MTYVGFVAACANLVVVCQVDIEDQFLGDGLERAGFPERLPVSGVGAVNWTDFEPGGVEAEDIFSKTGVRLTRMSL